MIKFQKGRFLAVKLWTNATCGPKMSLFAVANYRAALLVDGDVSHAEGPSGHIEKFSDMCNFRPAPHFRAF